MPTLRVKSGPLAGQTIEAYDGGSDEEFVLEPGEFGLGHKLAAEAMKNGAPVQLIEPIRAHAEESSAGVA